VPAATLKVARLPQISPMATYHWLEVVIMKLGLLAVLVVVVGLSATSTASAAKKSPRRLVCHTEYVLGGTITTCK
jgi:hypothetical protein